MLEANALKNIVELDVHPEVVRVEFEFVAWAETAVFVHVHRNRGDAAVYRELPVPEIAWPGVEEDEFSAGSGLHRILAPTGSITPRGITNRNYSSGWPASGGSQGLHGADEGLETCFEGVAGSVEDGVGLAVKGFTTVENAPEIAHGLAALCDRATITLLEHAGHVVFGCGAKPDGEAGTQQAIVVPWIGDEAAAGGQHETAVAFENAIERGALQAAIAGLAVEIKDDGQGQAGVPLDLAVELDERAPQALSQQRSERRLACSAQTGKGDARAAQAGGRAAKSFEQQAVRAVEVSRRELLQKAGGLLKRRGGGGIFRGYRFDGEIGRA